MGKKKKKELKMKKTGPDSTPPEKIKKGKKKGKGKKDKTVVTLKSSYEGVPYPCRDYLVTLSNTGEEIRLPYWRIIDNPYFTRWFRTHEEEIRKKLEEYQRYELYQVKGQDSVDWEEVSRKDWMDQSPVSTACYLARRAPLSVSNAIDALEHSIAVLRAVIKRPAAPTLLRRVYEEEQKNLVRDWEEELGYEADTEHGFESDQGDSSESD